jgi:hypothetical protein
MGILKYFNTVRRNSATRSSVKENFKRSQEISYLMFDFNSIIHVSSQQIIVMLNSALEDIQDGVVSLDYTNLSNNVRAILKQ